MINKFFTKEEEVLIIEAIQAAEHECTGEIKVHIEKSCGGKALDRAAKLFSILGMHKTRNRNAILIYIAYKDRVFSVIGDKGINAKVPEDFWDTVRDKMQEKFKKGDFTKGVCEAIDTVGAELKKNFPPPGQKINEITDYISFG